MCFSVFFFSPVLAHVYISGVQSQQLIQKLLKAEEDAEALISKARENRVRKLREAKQAADDELAIFRKKEEERFQAEISTASADTDSDSLEKQTLADIAQVEADFKNNREKIIEYMTSKILTVKPELGQIQIALLQTGAV